MPRTNTEATTFLTKWPYRADQVLTRWTMDLTLQKGLEMSLDRSTMYCASLVRCPVTSRHAYLAHIALVSTGANSGICQAAVYLLSVRTVTYYHYYVIACPHSTKYAKGH